MAHHNEMTSIPAVDEGCRFCLDDVIRDDEDGRHELSLVCRGTKATPDGFIPKPAYFSWDLLGRLIRKAIDNGDVSIDDFQPFMTRLLERNRDDD